VEALAAPDFPISSQSNVVEDKQMDIASFSSAYSAIKTIKEISGVLLDSKISSEAKTRVNEALEKLGNVQDTLFYIREELIKTQDENHTLKENVRELKQKLDEKGKVKYSKPSYWVVEGDAKDGPFCQKCYDVDNKLVRLQGGNNDEWHCKSCEAYYRGDSYKPIDPTVSLRGSHRKRW
jgi:ribosomal protein L37AE/L43A